MKAPARITRAAHRALAIVLGLLAFSAHAQSATNVALQANGGVASASSTYNANFPVAAVNNGDRKGLGWGSGGGWNDATSGTYPDWVQVTFSSTKTIGEIDVFTLQNNYSSPVEPTETLTFGSYGITGFDVQYWDGSAWVTVPNGSVSGNNLVWRKFTFSPVSTDRIRVLVNAALASYSRIVEVEAWEAQTYQVSGTVAASGSPVAGAAFAATNGATCTDSDASGQYDCTVQSGWSGTVTPSLAGYAFTPPSRSYSNISSSQAAQDFAAAPSGSYQVSGTVTASGSPVPGVAFAATNGGTCTASDASGQYDCTVQAGWSGTVTPSLTGYTFTPPSRSYSSVGSNQTAQDFAATGQTSATVFYIHADHLNTPRVVTNGAGQAVWRWDAPPFGDAVPDEDPSGLGAFVLPLRFPGQYFDQETNLHYNTFRDYDPAIGRYVQSDPIGLAGGLNTYAYASSNPLGAVDPLGLADTVTSRITTLAAQGRVAELRNLVNAGGLSSTQEATALGAISRLEQGVQGAKSAGELAKHVERLQDARDAAASLQRLIREATGKKTRDQLAKALEDLARSIRGHEKEIRQKWPDVAEKVCP